MKPPPAQPPTGRIAADALEPCGPTIGGHTTVDQANDIFADNPDTPRLLVVDDTGRCEGVVTRASLAAFLARNWYTQRTPVRDTHHQRGPFAWPTLPLALAAVSMRVRHHDVWPVTDDDGHPLGILTTHGVNDAMNPPQNTLQHPQPTNTAPDSQLGHEGHTTHG